jgi:hypothetical protein
MSAMAKTGRFNGRYLWTKLGTARDTVLNQMSNPEAAAQGGLMQMFQEAYKKQLTTIIAVTGAAMAPAINAVSTIDRLRSSCSSAVQRSCSSSRAAARDVC